MSSPKHLWSGDWERESAAISDELAGRRASAPAAAPAQPPAAPARHAPRATPRTARRRRRRAPRLSPGLRRALPVALAAALIVAAGAYGLSQVVGESSSPEPALSNSAGGPIDWLGMQIEGLPPGTVVVATVAPGSPAEAAGLDPGDVIVEVNGRPVNSTSDIADAVSGLHPGDSVQIQVNRGSTVVTTRATLVAPPSSHP